MDVFRRVRSIDDYRALLRRFLALYIPLETSLGSAVDWKAEGWDFDGRRKTPLLIADLKALGVADPASLPVATEIPVAGNLTEAVGVLYVLEGSTLGGQMISKQFGQALGISGSNGGLFFHGYGAETGMKWREFGQWAESKASAAGHQFQQNATRAAQATFEAFGRALT